ncbi:hypothetical protein [Luteolibacter sp. Populi]|uniref:hypothetical protein n=1 Tax=Luteolibacter sp. Populi TaxID=3230487 RepID=UPI003465201C
MSPIPFYVRYLITGCVAFPSALVRVCAIIASCILGTAWLFGVEGSRGYPTSWVFAAALAASTLGYLGVVGSDFITAKHRYAVDARSVLRYILIEIAVQSAGITGFCLLAACILGSPVPAPISPWIYGVLGLFACACANFLTFRYNLPLKEWKATWRGDYGIVPPPPDPEEESFHRE